MKKSFKIVFKYITLFFVMGFIYCSIEIIWRGHTHWTMLVLGGICGVSCGELNEHIEWEISLQKQVFMGTVIVTCFEFVFGCILNLWLGLDIWDYSSLPFNLLGQICIPFMFLWSILVMIAIMLDDWIRYLFFNEERPTYHI